MPLPTKTLREVAAEFGIPEAEIRALIDLGKIRAVFKKGTFLIAPDEIVKLRRERKTIPDSSSKAAPPSAPIAKPLPTKPKQPPRTFG
ncbi:MAG: helix-turn-helix domain-containing protein [Planctomycetota bacterium]